jgi:hypothetical protein
MIATVLFLLPPIVARLRHVVPPLDIHSSQELWKFALDQQIAHAIAAPHICLQPCVRFPPKTDIAM